MNKNVSTTKEFYQLTPMLFWISVGLVVGKNIMLSALILHLISEFADDYHWAWLAAPAYCLTVMGNLIRDADDFKQIITGN